MNFNVKMASIMYRRLMTVQPARAEIDGMLMMDSNVFRILNRFPQVLLKSQVK